MRFLKHRQSLGAAAAGLSAGTVNGLLGGGGGMILIPALQALCSLEEDSLFPTSVSVMLPVSALSLLLGAGSTPLPWADALPYLLGSAAGGVLVGCFEQKIPALWLHRVLGAMILWGGIRYLC